jgi:hypothetical protein
MTTVSMVLDQVCSIGMTFEINTFITSAGEMGYLPITKEKTKSKTRAMTRIVQIDNPFNLPKSLSAGFLVSFLSFSV